jgi:hypothetical protein
VGTGNPCAKHNNPNPSPELIINELLLSFVENLGVLAPTGSVDGEACFTVLPERWDGIPLGRAQQRKSLTQNLYK